MLRFCTFRRISKFPQKALISGIPLMVPLELFALLKHHPREINGNTFKVEMVKMKFGLKMTFLRFIVLDNVDNA